METWPATWMLVLAFAVVTTGNPQHTTQSTGAKVVIKWIPETFAHSQAFVVRSTSTLEIECVPEYQGLIYPVSKECFTNCTSGCPQQIPGTAWFLFCKGSANVVKQVGRNLAAFHISNPMYFAALKPQAVETCNTNGMKFQLTHADLPLLAASATPTLETTTWASRSIRTSTTPSPVTANPEYGRIIYGTPSMWLIGTITPMKIGGKDYTTADESLDEPYALGVNYEDGHERFYHVVRVHSAASAYALFSSAFITASLLLLYSI